MPKQTDINEQMRTILIDWLASAHYFLELQPQTLFQTIYILDKYLEKNTHLMRENLQLLGITCLFICSKYEEIYPPALETFAMLSANTYDTSQITQMETRILKSLEFNLQMPQVLTYLDRFCQLLEIKQNSTTHLFAQYVLEVQCLWLTLQIKFSPMQIAGAAIFLSLKLQNSKKSWNDLVEYQFDLTEIDIRECAKQLIVLAITATKMKKNFIREKYSHPEYKCVSLSFLKDQQDNNPFEN